jgi:hypothetical protein
VHARAVLQDERHRAGLRLGGVHVPSIGSGARGAIPPRSEHPGAEPDTTYPNLTIS